MKTLVLEELDYWGIGYLRQRMSKYGRKLIIGKTSQFQLDGIDLEDIVSDVFCKVLSGERSWEHSQTKDFVGFLLNCVHSEIGNYLKKNYYEYINEGVGSYYLKNKDRNDTFLYNAF